MQSEYLLKLTLRSLNIVETQENINVDDDFTKNLDVESNVMQNIVNCHVL